jgi:hypothetical protein
MHSVIGSMWTELTTPKEEACPLCMTHTSQCIVHNPLYTAHKYWIQKITCAGLSSSFELDTNYLSAVFL